MSMLFKRRDLQIACEVLARTQQGLPPESNDYRFKGELEVTLEELENLKECQKRDSVSFYFNSLFSFLQALKSIKEKSYSWATVQLYYSVFYSCKAILGFDQIGIIRKNGLNKLEIKVGEKAKGLKQENDHKQTIKCFTITYPDSFILSNNIGDQTFFEWIQDAREITNYRQQVFLEPRVHVFLQTIIDRIKNRGSYLDLLNQYSANWAIYCFQEESALIAGPYYLLTEVFQKYKSQSERMSAPEKKEILTLLKTLKLNDLNALLI